jgi:quinolinate synthase
VSSVLEKIKELKQKRGALLLAHYYEDGAIQDIADEVGDSLALAQFGQQSDKPVVLLAGVVFMAETVKMLAPEKTVLVPDLAAGCSLVTHSRFGDYLAWRHQFPDALAVTYVNSSASVKAISDVIVTSSNAEKIINAIPQGRKILFGPDRNLGRFLKIKTGRDMELWPGACEVHVLFSARKIFELKSLHPNALVLAHPECSEAVLREADLVGSTSRLLEESKNSPRKEFIVATEPGILHQMRRSRPDAVFWEAPSEGTCACNQCPYMKLNTLEKIASALEQMSPQIYLDPWLSHKGAEALDRMMKLTRGENVTWPDRFEYVAESRPATVVSAEA